MIRIRQQNGESVDIDRAEAVEILGLDRRVAAVIIQDRKGSIHVSYPGELLFTGYCRARNLAAARVHQHSASELSTR